jgi:ribosomal protein L37AE/L43A
MSEALRRALKNMIERYDRNTCTHASTHRGGGLWTVCDDCGMKWADDTGGFKPYVEPPDVTEARATLAKKPEGVPPRPINPQILDAMEHIGLELVRKGRIDELLRSNNELLERIRRAEQRNRDDP